MQGGKLKEGRLTENTSSSAITERPHCKVD